jgi:hypothetical protein
VRSAEHPKCFELPRILTCNRLHDALAFPGKSEPPGARSPQIHVIGVKSIDKIQSITNNAGP